jgi:hypothetical protein
MEKFGVEKKHRGWEEENSINELLCFFLALYFFFKGIFYPKTINKKKIAVIYDLFMVG